MHIVYNKPSLAEANEGLNLSIFPIPDPKKRRKQPNIVFIHLLIIHFAAGDGILFRREDSQFLPANAAIVGMKMHLVIIEDSPIFPAKKISFPGFLCYHRGS